MDRERADAVRAPLEIVVVKVLLAIAPALILQAVFVSHAKLAYFGGLLVGVLLWYFVPPRGNARHLAILIACAAILGLVRLVLP